MSNQDIVDLFYKEEAILKGHFILSSGLHSDTYMQCAKITRNAKLAEELCTKLAEKILQKLGNDFADIVVAPAMGGVIVGYEMSRQLSLPNIFCERVNGEFEFRRGFELKKDQRVLVVEDVITTGKSSLETYEIINRIGAKVVAQCCLVDRSNDSNLENKLGVPTISLVKIDIKTFAPDQIPAELSNIPAIKPGSRFLKA